MDAPSGGNDTPAAVACEQPAEAPAPVESVEPAVDRQKSPVQNGEQHAVGSEAELPAEGLILENCVATWLKAFEKTLTPVSPAISSKEEELEKMLSNLTSLDTQITSRLSDFDQMKASINELTNELRSLGVTANQAQIMDQIDGQDIQPKISPGTSSSPINHHQPGTTTSNHQQPPAPVAGGNRARKSVGRPPLAAGAAKRPRTVDEKEDEDKEDDKASVITVSSDEEDGKEKEKEGRTSVEQRRQRVGEWVDACPPSASTPTHTQNAGGVHTRASARQQQRARRTDVVEVGAASDLQRAAQLAPSLTMGDEAGRLVLTIGWHAGLEPCLKEYQVVYSDAINGRLTADKNAVWSVVRTLPVSDASLPKVAHVTKNEHGSFFLGARAVLRNGVRTPPAYNRVDV